MEQRFSTLVISRCARRYSGMTGARSASVWIWSVGNRTRARITGNIMMPGFTAPKLLWVSRHEPEIFQRTACVLLPKDYVRLRLTGEKLSDMSDASGTGWLDVGRRDWSDLLLAATGLTRAHMPRLVEGTSPAGTITGDRGRRVGIAACRGCWRRR